jgi:predicted permease
LFIQDLQYAWRMVIKRPGLSAVAVFSLGIAIGANTAIFSFINGILLRPLPVAHSESLVRVYSTFSSGFRWGSISYPNFRDFAEQNTIFSGLAAERPEPLILSHAAGEERILGSLASGNYFSLLGVRAVLGRTFSPNEDRTPGGNPLAVVSYGFWQGHLGGNSAVLGSTLTLNGKKFTVLGVAPPGFAGLNVGFVPDLWIPLTMQRAAVPGPDLLTDRGDNWLFVTGRLKPGVHLPQAQTAMDTVATHLRELFPKQNEGVGVNLVPENDAAIFPPLREAFIAVSGLLQVVVALVLMVACANVAGLFLAQVTARRKEMGVRLALGASRRRLMTQLLSESMLIALLAGGLGLLLAIWVSHLARSFQPPSQTPIAFDLSVDGRVLAFTLLITVATGALFGLAPMLQSSRPDLVPALKAGSAPPGFRRSRLRNALLVLQVTVSFILLVGAGLFFHSLWNMRTAKPGFDAEKLLVASLNVGFNDYTPADGERFYQQLLDRVNTLPGAQSASLARFLPFDVLSNTQDVVRAGDAPPAGEGRPQLDFNVVSERYFQTMGISLLEGRDFSRQDNEHAPHVVIVNQALAHKYWPNESALGKQLWIGGNDTHTVVGVARDTKYRSLEEKPSLYLYLPLYQNYQPALTLHLRAVGQPAGLASVVRREVAAENDRLALFDVKLMSEQIQGALLPARLASGLLAGMGGLALLLVMVGLYASTSYALTQRTREIGIRMSLGAQLGQVVELLVREGLILTGAGLVLGLLAAFALSRFAGSLLYNVNALDLPTFAAATVLLLGVGFLANLLPARRAARIQPNLAMRAE